jgi:hypothetical protein
MRKRAGKHRGWNRELRSDVPKFGGYSDRPVPPSLKGHLFAKRAQRETREMNKAGRISTRLILVMVIGMSVLSDGAGAVELPAGPNKDIVTRACGSCHDLDMVFEAAGQTREGWNGTIEEMTGYGLKVSATERAQILDYLAGVLGPDARKPQ